MAIKHWGQYDPVKAHEEYLKRRKLKGRKKGTSIAEGVKARVKKEDSAARAKQRQEITARIQSLSAKLVKLEALIRKKESAEASEDRKSKADKERAAKEADKPKTAAEKAKLARESKQYRDKHKSELASKAKKTSSSSSSGGSSSTSSTDSSTGASIDELRTLASKVKGQIAVAKSKLSAL